MAEQISNEPNNLDVFLSEPKAETITVAAQSQIMMGLALNTEETATMVWHHNKLDSSPYKDITVSFLREQIT